MKLQEITSMRKDDSRDMYMLDSKCPICGRYDSIPGEIQEGLMDGHKILRIFTVECIDGLIPDDIPKDMCLWMTIDNAKKWGVIK